MSNKKNGELVGTVIAYILLGMIVVVLVGAFAKYVMFGWLLG